jgi:hypothetical protein
MTLLPSPDDKELATLEKALLLAVSNQHDVDNKLICQMTCKLLYGHLVITVSRQPVVYNVMVIT